MQYIVNALGGRIERAEKREYGFAELKVDRDTGLLSGIRDKNQCWMSHGDSVKEIPDGFIATASTDNTPFAVIEDTSRRLMGVQFHPEVEHTVNGKRMLSNFIFDVCGCKKTWTMRSFAKKAIAAIKEEVGASTEGL